MRFLGEMKELIPFETIEKKLIEKGIYKPNKGKQGRPSIPAKILIGALFLQAWYGLSDPMTEELIYDHISFRKFLDIKDEDTIPDETTICKFDVMPQVVKQGIEDKYVYTKEFVNKSYEKGKESVNDTLIHGAIKYAFLVSKDIHSLKINVDVKDGVVELFGKVKSSQEAEKAIQIASSISKISRGENHE